MDKKSVNIDIIKDRNESIDCVKGVAIFLVVLGHCIQYGSGDDFLTQASFYENIFFRIIYSFHMPLFMLVSGYLFYYSAQKSFFNTLIGKIKSVLIPIISCSIVDYEIALINGSIPVDRGFIFLIKQFVWKLIGNLWFLWAILMCSIVVLLIKYYGKDRKLLYLLLPVLFFVTPDKLNLQYFKYMYPYFVLGYLCQKCNWLKCKQIFLTDQCQNKRKSVLLYSLLSLTYIALFFLFNKEQFIYTTGITILGKINPFSQIMTNILRWGIGLIGSILVVKSVHYLYNRIHYLMKYLAKFGRYSLGIYIVSGYINLYVLIPITRNFYYSIWIAVIESIVVLIICYLATKLLDNYKYLRKLFLGGR